MLEITTEYKGIKYRHDPEACCDLFDLDAYICFQCEFVNDSPGGCGGWVKVEEDETINKIKEFGIYLLDYPGVSCGEWTTEPFIDEVYEDWIASKGDAGSKT